MNNRIDKQLIAKPYDFASQKENMDVKGKLIKKLETDNLEAQTKLKALKTEIQRKE